VTFADLAIRTLEVPDLTRRIVCRGEERSPKISRLEGNVVYPRQTITIFIGWTSES
jgi:hypothetical protein